MCNPKPGPRCSAHTRQAYVKAVRSSTKILDEIAHNESRLIELQKDPNKAREAAQLEELQQKAIKRHKAAQEKADHAQEQWLATPDGIEHLEKKVKESSNPEDAQKLQSKLNEVKQRYADQKQALAIVKSARQSREALSDSDQEYLNGLEAESKEAYNKTLKAKKNLDNAQKQWRDSRRTQQQAYANSQDALAKVNESHTELAQVVKNSLMLLLASQKAMQSITRWIPLGLCKMVGPTFLLIPLIELPHSMGSLL